MRAPRARDPPLEASSWRVATNTRSALRDDAHDVRRDAIDEFSESRSGARPHGASNANERARDEGSTRARVVGKP